MHVVHDARPHVRHHPVRDAVFVVVRQNDDRPETLRRAARREIVGRGDEQIAVRCKPDDARTRDRGVMTNAKALRYAQALHVLAEVAKERGVGPHRRVPVAAAVCIGAHRVRRCAAVDIGRPCIHRGSVRGRSIFCCVGDTGVDRTGVLDFEAAVLTPRVTARGEHEEERGGEQQAPRLHTSRLRSRASMHKHANDA